MLPRSVYAILVVLVLAGCHWGPRAHLLETANTPAGARVRILLDDGARAREVELYAVDSAGVFVLDGRLRHVAWTHLRTFSIPRFGSDYSIYDRRVPPTDKRRRMALLSRFPQGLDGEVLANVLRLLQQPTVEYMPSEALDALADETARRTARYADRRLAMADGYRRIGTDFPGMGEHWLHSGSLIAGRIDAARPTLLAYVNVSGQPTLVGAGFVITTATDSATPNVPGWPSHWHEHSGLLADESGPRVSTSHATAPTHGARARNATRVWVLHIWTALDNPAGAYTSDNWALPFARAGLEAPASVDSETGRAFSLAVGGQEYLHAVLTDAQLINEHNASQVLGALDTARAAAERVRSRAQTSGSLDDADMQALRVAWNALADRLHALCGPAVHVILAPPHGHEPKS